MSRPLFFTSIQRPEMMFRAATNTISSRISRMVLRSTSKALKKLWFLSRQSVTMASGPAALATRGLSSPARSGSVSLTSMTSTACSRPKNSWACSSGM